MRKRSLCSTPVAMEFRLSEFSLLYFLFDMSLLFRLKAQSYLLQEVLEHRKLVRLACVFLKKYIFGIKLIVIITLLKVEDIFFTTSELGLH